MQKVQIKFNLKIEILFIQKNRFATCICSINNPYYFTINLGGPNTFNFCFCYISVVATFGEVVK